MSACMQDDLFNPFLKTSLMLTNKTHLLPLSLSSKP